MYRLKKEKIKFPDEASRCFPIFKWKTCHFCNNEFSFELGWKILLKNRYYHGTDYDYRGTDYDYLCSRCVNGDKQIALDIINDRIAEHEYDQKSRATKQFIKPPVKKHNPEDFKQPVQGTIEKKNFFNKSTKEELEITSKKEQTPKFPPKPNPKLESKFQLLEDIRRKESTQRDAKKIKDAISLLQGHMGINHHDYMDKANQNIAVASKLAMIETIRAIRGS